MSIPISDNRIESICSKTKEDFSPLKKIKTSNGFSINSFNEEEEEISYYSSNLSFLSDLPSSSFSSTDSEQFLKNLVAEPYSKENLEGTDERCNQILIKSPDSFFASKLLDSPFNEQPGHLSKLLDPSPDEQPGHLEKTEDSKDDFQCQLFNFEIDSTFVENCLQQGFGELAIQTLNHYLEFNPLDFSMHLLRAKCYFQTKQYGLARQSIIEIEKNLSLLDEEQEIEMHYLHAETHLQLGDLDKAYQEFKRILDLAPHHLQALERCLNICLKDESKKDKIIKYINKLNEYYPHLTIWQQFYTLYSKHTLYSENRTSEHMQELEKLCLEGLSLDPENPCFLYYHSFILYELSRYDEAKEVCLKGLKQYPNDTSFLSTLGFIEITKQDYNSALQYLDRCLTLDHKKKEVRKTRGSLYLNQQHYSLAYEDFNYLVKSGFKDPDLFLYSSQALAGMEQLESSLDYAYFAFRHASQNSTYRGQVILIAVRILQQFSETEIPSNYRLVIVKSLYYLSIIALKEGKIEDALKRLSDLLKIDPTYFPACYAKGVCLFKLDQLSESQACFSSSIDNHIKTIQASLSPTLEKMMQDAWKKKGVLLRPFQVEDATRFVDFYDSLFDAPVILNSYSLEKLYEMGHILEQDKTDSHNCEIICLQVPYSIKIKGCAYFKFIEFDDKIKVCKLFALKIAGSYQKHGFGSLMLNYIIQRAIKRGCHFVTLYSATAGLPLYFSYGFKPAKLTPEMLQEWEKCHSQAKIDFFNKEENAIFLKLDITDDNILLNVQKHLNKTLSRPFKMPEISDD